MGSVEQTNVLWLIKRLAGIDAFNPGDQTKIMNILEELNKRCPPPPGDEGARRGGSSAPACDCPPPQAAPGEPQGGSPLDLKRGKETTAQLRVNGSFFGRLRDDAVAHFAEMRPWAALGWAALYAWAVGGVLGVVALLVAGLCGVWP